MCTDSLRDTRKERKRKKDRGREGEREKESERGERQLNCNKRQWLLK
jgi:hypothetical protein